MTSSRSTCFCPGSLPAPTLFLYGPDGGGLLKLWLADGSKIAFRLYGRHVRVLLSLNNALCMDKDLDEAARGWMSDERIAEAYACGDPRVLPPTREAITAYRAQINRLIRQETPSGLETPRLFATQRCVGVRLAQAITVIDLRERRRDGESPMVSPS